MHSFSRNRSGATAIEYGLIAALLAVALIGALALFEPALAQIFETIGEALTRPRP
jgi:pilus assembly protein Flp/PilA